jgi:hypothetical protein
MGLTTLLPIRGSRTTDFIALKNLSSSAGSEPANLDSNAYLPSSYCSTYETCPVTSMQATRERGAIAPTHSWCWYYMGLVVNVTPWPRFTPGERAAGTRWKGGWVGLRYVLDTGTREKILCHCRGSNHGRPVCSQTLYWLSYPSKPLTSTIF